MAADFQGQFQEAMREAEMADLKKQVDDIAHDIKSYDPLKDVRADVEAAGKDIQSSLEQPAVVTPASGRRSPKRRSKRRGRDRDGPGCAGSRRTIGTGNFGRGIRAERLFA